MRVKSEREIAQLFLTLSDPMDCSLPGSSIHRIFQARVLEWDAIAFSYTMIKLGLFQECKDSSGKNIGVGCHFLLQCMKMKSESEVA